ESSRYPSPSVTVRPRGGRDEGTLRSRRGPTRAVATAPRLQPDLCRRPRLFHGELEQRAELPPDRPGRRAPRSARTSRGRRPGYGRKANTPSVSGVAGASRTPTPT